LLGRFGAGVGPKPRWLGGGFHGGKPSRGRGGGDSPGFGLVLNQDRGPTGIPKNGDVRYVDTDCV